jgi:hypothetical protein
MVAKIYVLFFIILILNGCNPISSNALENSICAPPCWNGIQPGKTTREEAKTILENSSDVMNNSIKTWSLVKENDSVKWEFAPRTGNRFGNLIINNDVVTGINFIPINNRLSLNRAINLFGDPETILVLLHLQEIRNISIFIGYPSKGIVLWISIKPYNEGDEIVLSENSTISGVWYVDLNFYDELLVSSYITGIPLDILINDTHKWTGYGDISSIIIKAPY